ncbi:MAG TPA: DUF6603 domain-containing protein, partial [Kofleriaceae bacterium]|nr:DUF6603 domain-containing protein [Kofleriaceae bacterium]
LDMVALVDDKLAENSNGFTAGRVVTFVKQGLGTVYDHQPGQLLIPELLPLLIFGVMKKWQSIAPNYDIALNAGWESPYLDRAYNRPESWRPTPEWIAQRTTSIEISPPQKFKLSRYYNALPQAEPDQYYSLTFVPVPQKRVWTGDPAHPPAEIADTQGPAMFIQFEGAAEHTWTQGNWSIELRGEMDHGVEVAIGGTADTDYTLGGGAEVEAKWTSPPLKPGTVDDREFAADSISFIGFAGGGVTANGFSSGEAGLGIRIAKARVTLQPDGGILKAILREPVKLDFDLGLMLTTRGFVLEGANGLDLFVPFKLPAHSPIGLSYLRISSVYDHQQIQVQAFGQDVTTNTTTVGGQLTAGVQINAGPLMLILDGIGVRVVASTSHPGGNLAGIGNLDASFVKPKGLGVKLDWGAFVHGGGFFSYDSKLERYSGAVELGFGQDNPTSASPKPKFVLRGVGFWEPQRDANGNALEDATPSGLALVTGEFAKWGIGGLFAVHRGMDLEAMRTAMTSGGADALLFPPDPVANATTIIASLATMFPPALPDADKHVLGVFGKLVWGAGFSTLSVGILAEWAGSWTAWPSKVAIPFSLRVGKKGKLAQFLWVEVDGVGSYDHGLDEWDFHAELHNSRIFGSDLVGGMTIFVGNPTPEDKSAPRHTFVSLGGYH